ncbi:hypothetical protein MTR_3g065705 [Medicago truncatula]|uniref:Retrotransposon gag domain-containing protein n=1 Tax=Medicago truncatula TaxID=3880 RepID=A0A072V8T2_MEDTR|nr:hypothetical protein MTR_3g065705 [Medicago truncatula]
MIEVLSVNCDRQTSTPASIDIPRKETEHHVQQMVIPIRKAPLFGPPLPKEGTSNVYSTKVLLNNIIKNLCQQTQVINDQNRRIREMEESRSREMRGRSPTSMTTIRSPTPHTYMPFTKRTRETRIPTRLEKLQRMETYDKTFNQDEQIKVVLNYRNKRRFVKCKLFMTTLRGGAMMWYKNLKRNSIDS